GSLKKPGPGPLGAGEGTAHVAEELALEWPLGQRGVVLSQEGAPRARAVIVDGAREELLAGAGLALEQHRDPRLRRALGQEERLLDGGALADDAVEAVALAQLAAEPAHLAARGAERASVPRGRPLQLAATERLAHHHRYGDEVLAVLDEVVARPELHRLDRHLLRTGAGDHHDRHVGPALPDLAQALESVGVGQAVVEEDAVDLVLGEMAETVAGRAHGRDLERVAPRAEPPREKPRRLGVIFDQQDARRAQEALIVVHDEHGYGVVHRYPSPLAGRRTVKQLPAPGRDSTATLPSCASTMRFTTARPTPVPPTARSSTFCSCPGTRP